ncbi:NPCBM/NEW2 domain-containing protein [Planotetraspora sp. GP83]|uniref:NPCBM/NEW2 domain-containing protein n=1 Tax=Planotetraspora sp. GP83 TaxID=3156264 RepID=UPI003516B5EA
MAKPGKPNQAASTPDATVSGAVQIVAVVVGLGQILAVGSAEALLTVSLLLFGISVLVLVHARKSHAKRLLALALTGIVITSIVSALGAYRVTRQWLSEDVTARPPATTKTPATTPATTTTSATLSPLPSPKTPQLSVSAGTPVKFVDSPSNAKYLGNAESLDLDYSAHEGLIYRGRVINGVEFDHSIGIRADCDRDSVAADNWADFKLDDQYNTFQAVIGISDSSDDDITDLTYEVYFDGLKVHSETVSRDNPTRLALSIAGASQIRLLVKRSADVRCTGSGLSRKAIVAFGGAAVIP